ncbi:MAG: SDR family oxidoreductase [bacterium]
MRTLIVTGASSGIGLETTKKLLDRGYRVIGIARDPTRAMIDASNFIPIELDLANLSILPQAFSKLNRDYPDISGLIACAGRGRFGAIEEFSYEQIKALFDLNFMSACFLVKALMPSLKKFERSDIIFIGSEAALAGGKQGAIYCATKFALRGLAQSLRKECAKSAVRVTLINPGMVKTSFFDSLSFEPGAADDNYIEADNVAETIFVALEMRPATVIDEINLSPLKKVIVHKPKRD